LVAVATPLARFKIGIVYLTSTTPENHTITVHAKRVLDFLDRTEITAIFEPFLSGLSQNKWGPFSGHNECWRGRLEIYAKRNSFHFCFAKL